MAFRILAVALLACVAQAQQIPNWNYLPTNTIDIDTGEATDGLVFYFAGVRDATVRVTVDAIRDGKPVCEAQEIDTDRTHGERLVFHIKIDPEHRHELLRVRIETAKRIYTIHRPRSGQRYAMWPR